MSVLTPKHPNQRHAGKLLISLENPVMKPSLLGLDSRDISVHAFGQLKKIHFPFSGSGILHALWAHVIFFSLCSECPMKYCSLEKTYEEEKTVKMWCHENGNCGQFLILNSHLLYSNKNKMFGRVFWFSLETILSVCWINQWWQTGETADLEETNSISPGLFGSSQIWYR